MDKALDMKESPGVQETSVTLGRILLVAVIVLAVVASAFCMSRLFTPDQVRALAIGDWTSGSGEKPGASLNITESEWTLEYDTPAIPKAHGTWSVIGNFSAQPEFVEAGTGKTEEVKLIKQHGHQLPQLIFRGRLFFKMGIKD